MADSSDEDPEPACPPPEWASDIIQAARARVGQDVYPPSDDTFLLLEVLQEDAPKLQALRPKVCLELGCGSGAASVGLWDVLCREGGGGRAGRERCPCLMLAIDKNPAALTCTKELFHRFEVPLAEVMRASMTTRFCRMEADIVICNPPYVPTDDDEMQGCGISVSWAGGKRGREIIDIMMPEVARVLAPEGLFYLVCIAENDPAEILALGRSLGLVAEVARREQRGMEELFILRFHADAKFGPNSGNAEEMLSAQREKRRPVEYRWVCELNMPIAGDLVRCLMY